MQRTFPAREVIGRTEGKWLVGGTYKVGAHLRMNPT